MSKNFCIIELYKGHSECIYSQYIYLKNRNLKVFLISEEKAYSKLPELEFDDIYLFKSKGIFHWLKTLFEIKKFLKKNKISTCIINTAENNKVRDLLLFTKNISFFGIIHHIKKLDNSFTQKIITKKIRGYFTLNDYLTNNIRGKIDSAKKIDTLYSIFYPATDNMISLKPDNEIWIGIPGNIELKRRNYLDLIDAVKNAGLKKTKFLFLGKPNENDIKTIEEKIIAHNIENRFIWFNSYLENNLFLSYINNCDFIMPLIHHELREEYINNRISGSFNLGFGLKKPFLIEEKFKEIEDFNAFSIFYSHTNLKNILKQIDSGEALNDKFERQLGNYSKFDFNRLKIKYLDMIEAL